MSGIVSIYSPEGKNILLRLFYGTVSMQHRGEEGYGIGIPSDDGDEIFKHVKGEGLAYYGLKGKIEKLSEMNPSVGIGHTLYEKSGDIQPVKIWCKDHAISLAMDGTILGYRGKDNSIVKRTYSDYLKETGDFFEAGELLMEELDGKGAYNVVMMVERGGEYYMVALRDPKGIKPMCIGQNGDTTVFASESKAMQAVEADLLRDVEPGEMFVVSKKGVESRVLKRDDHAHCIFEWIYFADPTSTIEGRNVYLARKAIGAKLAQRYSHVLEDIDFVAPSPDSGRGVAIGLQQELSRILGRFVPYEEAMVKNPGAKRTFQVEDPEERKLASKVKFFSNEEIVEGKDIIVADDSVVRGTVFKYGMVDKLKRAGAKKVSGAISCSPLCHACIKDPKGKDFVAKGIDGDVERIGIVVAGKIGADNILYPTIVDMEESVGLPGADYCKACVDGKFPIDDVFLADL